MNWKLVACIMSMIIAGVYAAYIELPGVHSFFLSYFSATAGITGYQWLEER